MAGGWGSRIKIGGARPVAGRLLHVDVALIGRDDPPASSILGQRLARSLPLIIQDLDCPCPRLSVLATQQLLISPGRRHDCDCSSSVPLGLEFVCLSIRPVLGSGWFWAGRPMLRAARACMRKHSLGRQEHFALAETPAPECAEGQLAMSCRAPTDLFVRAVSCPTACKAESRGEPLTCLSSKAE